MIAAITVHNARPSKARIASQTLRFVSDTRLSTHLAGQAHQRLPRKERNPRHAQSPCPQSAPSPQCQPSPVTPFALSSAPPRRLPSPSSVPVRETRDVRPKTPFHPVKRNRAITQRPPCAAATPRLRMIFQDPSRFCRRFEAVVRLENPFVTKYLNNPRPFPLPSLEQASGSAPWPRRISPAWDSAASP